VRLAIAAVVPTYQPEGYLVETLRSLMHQTLPPTEVIVVDDGSRPRVVLPELGLPVRLLRLERAGIAAARNAGVRASSSPLIHVCDHDDLLDPRFYERIAAEFAAFPAATVVQTDCGFVDADGRALPGRLPGGAGPRTLRRPLRRLLEWNSLASVASVFRRELFDSLGGFRDLWFVQDWDFWLRAARRDAAFRFVPEVLAWHRVHAGQQSSRRADALAESIRMLDALELPLLERWGRARSRARLRLELARLQRAQ
jgi:glycosyltransferase involved in cell wall biosynthesis